MAADGVVVEERDRAASGIQHPIVIVLDNLRSAYNVGNIFRLAEVAGAQEVITCGYTATPPHPKLTKTARGCDSLVRARHFSTSLEAVRALASEGFQTIAVETVEDAPSVWEIAPIFPAAFVFGNEALGIDSETLIACDLRTRLPVFGQKNSLNVSNCAAAAVYFAIYAYYQSKEIKP